MQLSLGEPKPVRLEDGSVFMVAPVRSHGWSFLANAIVLNDHIKRKAAELLVPAQAMAQAKATRVSFFRRSREALHVGREGGVPGEGVYERAEREAQEAQLRVEMLFALASGEGSVARRVITLSDWRDLLSFFHQDTSIGSVQEGGEHV